MSDAPRVHCHVFFLGSSAAEALSPRREWQVPCFDAPESALPFWTISVHEIDAGSCDVVLGVFEDIV